jgi:hypothetical protein
MNEVDKEEENCEGSESPYRGHDLEGGQLSAGGRREPRRTLTQTPARIPLLKVNASPSLGMPGFTGDQRGGEILDSGLCCEGVLEALRMSRRYAVVWGCGNGNGSGRLLPRDGHDPGCLRREGHSCSCRLEPSIYFPLPIRLPATRAPQTFGWPR